MIAEVLAMGATAQEIEYNAVKMVAPLFHGHEDHGTWYAYAGYGWKLVILNEPVATPMHFDAKKWQAKCQVGMRKMD